MSFTTGHHGIGIPYLMCSSAAAVLGRSATSVSGRAANGAVDSGHFGDVLGVAYLLRGFTKDFHLAISVLWIGNCGEVTIRNCVPLATWIMNKHWLIGQVTILVNLGHQTRTRCSDSAVCGTASGGL